MEFLDDDAQALDAAHQTQQTLVDTQERLGMMLDVMPMGFLIHTEQAIIFANQEACRLLDTDKGQAVGQHVLDFIAPEQTEAVGRQILDSFRDRGSMPSQEIRLPKRNGDVAHIKLISCRLPWQGNPVVQVLLQDVTDLKRTEEQLRLLSETDSLTGCHNRRYALTAANRCVRGAGIGSPGPSAILFDIDHFKAVNDRHGHQAGDMALRAVADACQDTLNADKRPGAVFARFGGEEFIVLLPDAELSDALGLAERLRRCIDAVSVSSPCASFGITASFGVAQWHPGESDIGQALARADGALYLAKASGRNRVAIDW